jgi:hypothetical protein
MKRLGQWLVSRYPDVGVYLFVWVSNPAQKFYERIGGRNAENVEIENPGGGVGRYFRYVWENPYRMAPNYRIERTRDA